MIDPYPTTILPIRDRGALETIPLSWKLGVLAINTSGLDSDSSRLFFSSPLRPQGGFIVLPSFSPRHVPLPPSLPPSLPLSTPPSAAAAPVHAAVGASVQLVRQRQLVCVVHPPVSHLCRWWCRWRKPCVTWNNFSAVNLVLLSIRICTFSCVFVCVLLLLLLLHHWASKVVMMPPLSVGDWW